VTQCDLWFPEPRIPVGAGQERMLPVLVMTLAFCSYLSAVMIPSRQAGDIALPDYDAGNPIQALGL
jgi:hypothetical protein